MSKAEVYTIWFETLRLRNTRIKITTPNIMGHFYSIKLFRVSSLQFTFTAYILNLFLKLIQEDFSSELQL